MQKCPHMLIEGMIIAAYAAGANTAFIYIRGEYAQQAEILERAVAGGQGGGPARRADPRHWPLAGVHRGAGAYICGEETGLLDSLEGKRGNPRLKPPFPANQGLYQGPTLINNVETLATMPHIVGWAPRSTRRSASRTRRAPSSSRSRATSSGPATTRSSSACRRGRSSTGWPAGRREGRKVKLWFPGGSSSPVLTARRPRPRLRLRHAGQGRVDARLRRDHRRRRRRPRSSTSRCGWREFYRHESCGKCTPCREGTNWTVKMLERIAVGARHADGPRHHGLGPGADHRQLPVRAGRRDGDAGRLDDRQVPRTSSRSTSSAPASEPAGHRGAGALAARGPGSRGARCPAPAAQPITFSIDGREVTAPENTMLVDAAKLGDVEIPVFCYEPKLGAPVGACRMCLVEIEGIPKLQTGCSTPVKDGMVVHTQTERVSEAQEAVVEFLLINHPLDCPVCDKGGECPLQDISFGWGGGARASSSPSAISSSRWRSRRWSRSTASAASSATAACASPRRSPRTTSWSSRSAARTRSSARSTATRTSRRSAATSSSCAPWAR